MSKNTSPYAQARYIRNKSLSSLIAGKISEGGGIGSSIAESISEKTKARMMGLKEKFDPLNIAKKLTGNLGAAMLGRMTGRSKADMQYFTGIRTGKYNSSKLSPAAGGSNVNDITKQCIPRLLKVKREGC